MNEDQPLNQPLPAEDIIQDEPSHNRTIYYLAAGALLLITGTIFAVAHFQENTNLASNIDAELTSTTSTTSTHQPAPSPTTTPEKTPEQLDSATTSTTTNTTVTPGYQTYRNEEWGFAFEYPEGWEALENTFGAYSSLFNVVLQPEGGSLPDPISFSVSFDEWCEGLLARKRARGDEIRNTTIGGYTAYYYDSTAVGLPTKVYLIELDGDRWIITHAKTEYTDTKNTFPGYEKEFNHLLDTLTFIE